MSGHKKLQERNVSDRCVDTGLMPMLLWSIPITLTMYQKSEERGIYLTSLLHIAIHRKESIEEKSAYYTGTCVEVQDLHIPSHTLQSMAMFLWRLFEYCYDSCHTIKF